MLHNLTVMKRTVTAFLIKTKQKKILCKGIGKERGKKMNIKSTAKLLVLAKNEREGNNRQMYYNLAVMSEGEAGNISCTQDAYDKAELNTMNDVVFAYNEQYKSFRIIDIISPVYIPNGGTDTENSTPNAAQDTKQFSEPGTKPESDVKSVNPDTKQGKAAK